MNIKSILKNEIALSLEKLLAEGKAVTANSISIEHPENLEHGDFSTNCAMVFLKESEGEYKSPRDFAQAIIENLKSKSNPKLNPYIKKIEIAGPGFINFHLNNSYFAEMLNTINTDIDLFARPPQKKTRASLEHTDMNPNKELHVGHLRNSCIGEAMVNLLRYSGRDVAVQYYQNDAGLQISSIVLAYKEKLVDPADFPKLHKWAAEAYVDIEKRLELEKEEAEKSGKSEAGDLTSKRDKIQSNIASQDNEDARLAKELTDEILRNVLEVMSEFGIYFDLIVCESEILKNKIWEAALEILKKSPAFYQAKDGERAGCWLVKMPNAEDKVFIRSNGIPNYVATDFAYELWKFGLLPDFKYEPFELPFYKKPLDITSSTGVKKEGYNRADEVYLVIDTTQSYPQQSIVEALKVLGYKEQSEKYHHIAYGFVYLSNKTADKLGVEVEDPNKPIKMSGRSGTVVSVDTFIKEVEESLVKKFGDFSSLKDVRNGAIKFEMLKNNTYQDMVFDLDAATDNKGFTGPYIQYTYARALSVLRKGNRDGNLSVSSSGLNTVNEDETKLLKGINRLPGEIEFSIEELSPHYICHYMYGLAQAYNAFYNSNQIIGSECETERLAMTQSVANSLNLSLKLLGIEAPTSI